MKCENCGFDETSHRAYGFIEAEGPRFCPVAKWTKYPAPFWRETVFKAAPPLPDVAGDVEAAMKRVENCGWQKGEMQEVDDLLLLASALRSTRSLLLTREEELAKMREAIDTARDNILHERDSMAEMGFTSEQVNSVLAVFDDVLTTNDRMIT